MKTICIWEFPKPQLEVVNLGTFTISNCYWVTRYKITSRYKFPNQMIYDLQKHGMIVNGQQTNIVEKEKFEMVKCQVIDTETQKKVDIPAINPYSGKEYEDHKMEYYEYDIDVYRDSGD